MANARSRGSQAHRKSALGTMFDLVDGSIGAYLLRQRLGRSTVTRAERRAEDARAEALKAADPARWRLTSARPRTAEPPTHLVVAGTAAPHSVRDLPRIQAHPLTVATTASTLGRRPTAGRRDPARLGGLVAATGLVVVLVAAVAVWPRGDSGVLSTTGTPGASVVPVAPSDAPGATTQAPSTVDPTATPATPTDTPTADPTRSSTPATPRPPSTPRPTATPRRTATPAPTASPTPAPTAAPTAEPTPSPSPAPTPTPSPASTPTPAPTPAPSSTPTPTAVSTASPSSLWSKRTAGGTRALSSSCADGARARPARGQSGGAAATLPGP